jgi:superfamily II DNA or RNA helicase
VPRQDTVYNLHVARHENYFVEGCLVHNCHHAPAATWDSLIGRVKPRASLWGFSATPWHDRDVERNDRLVELFQEFFTIERERVEASGHLTKGKVYLHDLDEPGQFDPAINTAVAVEVEKRFRQFPILWDIPKVKGLTSSLKAVVAKMRAKAGAEVTKAASEGRLQRDNLVALGIAELVDEAARLSQQRDDLVKKEHEKRAKWQITQEFLQANENRNSAIVSLLNQETQAGQSSLCLVASIDHGGLLAARVPEARLVHSKLGNRVRRGLIGAFRDGSLRVLFATSLADEGLDVPRASRLVLAAGGRSSAKLEQRAGRVLRPFEGKSHGVVHDFLDRGALFAWQQAKARMRAYDELGYAPEIIHYEVKKAA